MRKINYVTTNIDKFNKAVANLPPSEIELIHQPIELQEIQSVDGEKIVCNKAEQAYALLKQPILVNDDTWSIPALRGFPSTGMKLCNDFLLAEDWLRLMDGIQDRRIFLQSHFAYHDGKKIHHMMNSEELFLLHETKGLHAKSPCLQVIGREQSGESISEEIAAKKMPDQLHSDFWSKLARLLAA